MFIHDRRNPGRTATRFAQERYPEGHPKGGQFKPKGASDEGDKVQEDQKPLDVSSNSLISEDRRRAYEEARKRGDYAEAYRIYNEGKQDVGDPDVVREEVEQVEQQREQVAAQEAARERRKSARETREQTPVAREGLFHSANRHMTDGDASTGDLSPESPWTPERKAMHEEIISLAVDGVPSVENPTVYFMGGGPASGKSTLLESGQLVHPATHVTLDPDQFKQDLPDYREGVAAGDTKAAWDAHEESSYLNKQTATRAMSESKDCVWDGTGDNSVKSMMKKINEFREAGYRIQADYATLDTELAVKLARQRGQKTGRIVPDEVIRATHAKVSSIWPNLARQGAFDDTTLYDTNVKGVAKPIAKADRSGTIQVLDPEAYASFLKKAEL